MTGSGAVDGGPPVPGSDTTTDRPVLALLTSDWDAAGEAGWFARQVAGALATVADVHVVTPGEGTASITTDSVFDVHRLDTGSGGIPDRRRDLLLDALIETGHDPTAAAPADVAALLDRILAEPWANAPATLSAIAPDQVVLVDHRNIGALGALDRLEGGLPYTVVALDGGSSRHGSRYFDPVVDRAQAVLAVTEDERQRIVGRHGRSDSIHRVGTPLAANPSVLTEPNPWMGDTGYLLVITDSASGDDDEQTELARLLRVRFSDRPVGIVHRDGFHAWHEGRLETGWPIERSSDLARLMAWARVTVDLRTLPLFGRDCLTSLLFGTPIVVPARSPASEHARRGGGLWFDSAADLTWCLDSLTDPTTAAAFGAQGRAYAEEGYGSTDRFIDRVVTACGLSPGSAARIPSVVPVTVSA